MTKVNLEHYIENLKMADRYPDILPQEWEVEHERVLLQRYVEDTIQKLAASRVTLDVYRIAGAIQARLEDTHFANRVMIFPTDTMHWLKSEDIAVAHTPYGIAIEVIEPRSGNQTVYSVKVRLLHPARR